MTVLCDSCSPRKQCTEDKNRTECKYYQPMTNEEWLRQANTEQLAKLLTKVDEKFPCGTLLKCNQGCGLFKKCISDDTEPTNEEAWVEWLKQPHTEKE